MAKIGKKAQGDKPKRRPQIVDTPYTEMVECNWTNHGDDEIAVKRLGEYAVQTQIFPFCGDDSTVHTTVMRVKIAYDMSYGLHRAEADYYCVVAAGTVCVTHYPEGEGAPSEDHVFTDGECFLIEKGAIFDCRATLKPEPRQLPNYKVALEMVWFFNEPS